jgi:hypothetical protein
MSQKVKCVDCKLAEWQRTPTGRFKKNEPGCCEADVKAIQLPKMISRSFSVSHQMAIWPDYEGECDLFVAKP